MPDVDSYVESNGIQKLVAAGNISLGYASIGAVYYRSRVAYTGGSTSTVTTVPGIADGDVIVATLNASANATSVTKAEKSRKDAVRITFGTNPGAGTSVSLLVLRSS